MGDVDAAEELEAADVGEVEQGRAHMTVFEHKVLVVRPSKYQIRYSYKIKIYFEPSIQFSGLGNSGAPYTRGSREISLHSRETRRTDQKISL